MYLSHTNYLKLVFFFVALGNYSLMVAMEGGTDYEKGVEDERSGEWKKENKMPWTDGAMGIMLAKSVGERIDKSLEGSYDIRGAVDQLNNALICQCSIQTEDNHKLQLNFTDKMLSIGLDDSNPVLLPYDKENPFCTWVENAQGRIFQHNRKLGSKLEKVGEIIYRKIYPDFITRWVRNAVQGPFANIAINNNVVDNVTNALAELSKPLSVLLRNVFWRKYASRYFPLKSFKIASSHATEPDVVMLSHDKVLIVSWSSELPPFPKGNPSILTLQYDRAASKRTCSMNVYNNETGEHLYELNHDKLRYVREFDDRIVAADEDGLIKVWGTNTGALINECQTNQGLVRKIIKCSDRSFLVDGVLPNGCQSIKAWNFSTGDCLLELNHGNTFKLKGLYDGSIISYSHWGDVKVWDTENNRYSWSHNTNFGDIRRAAKPPLVFDNTLIVGLYNGLVKVFDIKTGKQLREFRVSSSNTYGLAMRKDGALMTWEVNGDPTLKIWDMEGNLLHQKNHGSINSAYGLHNAMLLRSNKESKMLDQEGNCIWTINDASDSLYMPDGEEVVVTSNGLMKIWDKQTGELICRARDSGPLHSDGHTLVSLPQHNVVNVYKIPTIEQLIKHVKNRK